MIIFLQQQTTEDRRKSLLDQHWAIPSKDRMSIDQGSEVGIIGIYDSEKQRSINFQVFMLILFLMLFMLRVIEEY